MSNNVRGNRFLTGTRKSQVALEVVIAFVLTCVLMMGIIHIWIWADVQLIARQKAFEHSRTKAGQPDPLDNDKELYFPVYTPKKLNEGDVVGRDIFGSWQGQEVKHDK